MTILITGSAGFIGYHLSKGLLEKKNTVLGLDDLNNYYCVKLKKKRLSILKKYNNFFFFKQNINNEKKLKNIFEKFRPKIVINLAAYAGVRHSLLYPEDYIQTNIVGFHNIINLCKRFSVKHLIYASSSSVYGDIKKKIFSEKDNANSPVSLYGATKLSNELISCSYSKIFKIKTTGLRFFTVYGPLGRPDMALYLFADAISKNKNIKVYNYGKMSRDFTYVEDVVNAIIKIIEKENVKRNFHEVYNIGYGKKVPLMKFVKEIEKNLKRKAKIKYFPMQKGDVISSNANINKILKDYKFKPQFNYKYGISKFIEWLKNYK